MDGRPEASRTPDEKIGSLGTKHVEDGFAVTPVELGSYRCALHPEILNWGKGACPICGVSLESLLDSEDVSSPATLADLTRRFWWGLAATAPLAFVNIGNDLAGSQAWIGPRFANWIGFCLATPVVLGAGWPLLKRGIYPLLNLRPNIFTPVAAAIGLAWIYSTIATTIPQAFPPSLIAFDGAVSANFETPAAITVIVLLGLVLAGHARAQAFNAIRAVLEQLPLNTKRQIPGGVFDEATLELIKSADRNVIWQVFATICRAQRSQADLEHVAERFSKWLVRGVLAFAPIVFVAWTRFGPVPGFASGVTAAVASLVIASPCALELATQLAMRLAIARAALTGILFKDARSLERLERTDRLIIGDTGTLTAGKPTVTALLAMPDFLEVDCLRLAASLESEFQHPLAIALTAAAHQRKIPLAHAEHIEMFAGKGAKGLVDGRQLTIGSARFLEEQNIDTTGLAARIHRLRHAGSTVFLLGIDGVFAAAIAVGDPILHSTPGALMALKDAGVEVVLVTGDSRVTAQRLAERLGIAEVHAEILPEQKSAIVEGLRRAGKIAAMAGHDINDIPALAAADLGILMGMDLDVGREIIGITLLQGDLTSIVRAKRLSRATMKNMRHNLVFVLVYNAVGVPLAGGLNYLLFGSFLVPIVAALAMSLSSLCVAWNALRLRKLLL